MRARQAQILAGIRKAWCGLRQWCGDSAYETYLARANRRQGRPVLSRSEFYIEQLNRKYSRPNRCC